MLTTIQAEQIGRDCIRQATGFSGSILPSSVLNTIGVVDSDAREAVNDESVTNPSIGVNNYGPQLGASTLTFTTLSHFFELTDEIFEKAVPAQQVALGAAVINKNVKKKNPKPVKKHNFTIQNKGGKK